MNDTPLAANIPMCGSNGYAAWLQRFAASVCQVLRVRPAADRMLRHVETLPLGPRRAVHLMECNGQHFLVSEGLSSPVLLHAPGNQVQR